MVEVKILDHRFTVSAKFVGHILEIHRVECVDILIKTGGLLRLCRFRFRCGLGGNLSPVDQNRRWLGNRCGGFYAGWGVRGTVLEYNRSLLRGHDRCCRRKRRSDRGRWWDPGGHGFYWRRRFFFNGLG